MFDMYTFGLKPIIEPIISKYHSVRLPEPGSYSTFNLLEEWPDFKFVRPKGTPESIESDFILSYRGWELFQQFSIENILMTIGCILTEHKVILINDNLYKLTEAVLTFVALLYPFKWTTNTIPILPSDLYVFLDSPVPYIAGVTVFPDEIDDPDIVTIDMMEDKINMATPDYHVVKLPFCDTLFHTITPLCDIIKTTTDKKGILLIFRTK